MKTLPLLSLAFLGLACGWSDEVLRPEGTTAEITGADGTTYVAELLAFQDSSLFCLKEGVKQVSLRNVNKITLKRVDRYLGWAPTVLICEGIPSIVMLTSLEDKGPGFVAAAITIMTWFLLDTGTPQVEFSRPLSPGDIDRLRLYARYPQGLTAEHFQLLEAHRDSLRNSGSDVH